MKKQAIFSKMGMGIASLALLTSIGCNRSQSNLAVVNGEAITMDEFHSYLKVKPEVQIRLPSGEVTSAAVNQTLGYQALQDLIRQRVIVQLSKDMDVEPTDDEIVKEVDFQRARRPKFVTDLLERGLSMDQIKQSLRVDLAREKLLTKGITLKEDEVDKYIKNNPREFTEPEMVDALWIFVRDDRGKRDVDRALTAGTSFSSVATRYSQAPDAKSNGGAFATRVIDAIPSQQVQDLMRKTPKGRETAWVQLQDGWAKFQINDRTEAKKLEIKDTDRKWIERQLKVRQGLQANDLDKRLLDKLQNSKIEVSVRELKAPWEAAMAQLSTEIEERNKVKSPTDETSPAANTGNASTPTGR